jgi:hypothetical protein
VTINGKTPEQNLISALFDEEETTMTVRVTTMTSKRDYKDAVSYRSDEDHELDVLNGSGHAVATYAPGMWRFVEVLPEDQ